MKKILFGTLFVIFSIVSFGGTWEVTVGGDAVTWPGPVGVVGNLRWAIDQANAAGAGPHTITFNVSLANSTITAANWPGWDVTGTGITIDGGTNNITINAASYRMLVSGNNNSFKNLTFIRNTYTNDGPLDIQSDFNTIDNCTFGGNVWLGKVSPMNESSDNTIINSTFNGHLEIEGDRNVISDTYVEGNFILGNFLPINADDNIITNVTVGNPLDLSSTSRILFIGNNNVLDNVNLTGTSVIFATGSNNTYKNSEVNVVTDPNVSSPGLNAVVSESGVELTSGTSSNIIDNVHVQTILPIDRVVYPVNGVQVNDNSNGNTIVNSLLEGMWNGIHINSSSGTIISDNEVTQNVNMGIIIERGSGAVITGNDAHNNFNGIHIFGGNAITNTVEDNDTYNNTNNGIAVEAVTNSSANNQVNANYSYGNGANGIEIAGASGTAVDGNFIGLDRSLTVIGNDGGIVVSSYNEPWGSGISDFNTIGSNSGNTIVGSRTHGIYVKSKDATYRTSRTTILNNNIGNYTGTNATYENGEHGILVNNFSVNNIIGNSGSGNVISNKANAFAAIAVSGSAALGNKIQGNSTSCNAGKGIELISNGNANYGAFTSPATTSGQLTFNTAYPSTGTKIGGRAPGVGAIIDIYIANACDGTCQGTANGNPQGATWVGQVVAIANPGADPWAIWEATIASYPGLTYDNAVVTATSPSASTKNTSEFAVCQLDLNCVDPTTATLTPANTDFCENGSATIAVASDVTTGVKYSWSDANGYLLTTTTNSIVVSATGVYKVVVFDTGDSTSCNEVSNTVVVTEHNNPVPTGSITGPDSVCLGEQAISYTFNQTGFDEYVWGAAVNATKGTANANVIPLNFNASAGDATISITVGQKHGAVTCYSQIPISKTIKVIDMNIDPILDGPKTPNCNSTGNVYSITNIASFDPNYTVNWTVPSGATITDNSTFGEVTVSMGEDGGVVTATVVSTNGCSSNTTPLAITVIGCGIKADFAIQPEACSGDVVTLLNNSSFGNGAFEFDSVYIKIETATPGATAAPDEIIVKNVGLNETYPITFLTTTDAVFNITVFVKDDLGATDDTVGTSSILVKALPTAPVIDFNGTCEGDTAEFWIDTPSATATYIWSSSESFHTENGYDSVSVINPANSYSVSVIAEENGCESSLTTVNPRPLAGISGISTNVPTFVCDEMHTVPTAERTFSVGVASGNATYAWSIVPNVPTQGSSTASSVGYIFPVPASAEEVYKLTVEVKHQDAACVSSDTTMTWDITVDSSDLVRYEIKEDTVCIGESHVYNAYIPSGFDQNPGTASYIWVYNGDTLYSDGVGGYDSFPFGDIANVQPNDMLEMYVTPNYCYIPTPEHYYTDTLELQTVSRPGADLWVDKSENGLPVGNETNTILTLEDYGDVYLFDDTQRTLTLADIFDYNVVWSEVLAGQASNGGDSLHFLALEAVKNTVSPNFYYYAFTPKQDTTKYIMTVSNKFCSDFDTVLVVIDFDIFIPNVFTPNGDGTYDTWEIKNIDRFKETNKVTVYNRWGTVVFDESGYDNSDVVWNGTKDGDDLPFGTYYYIVDLGNGTDPYSGYVSIIK